MTSHKTIYTLRIDRHEVRLRTTAIGIQVKLERGTVIAEPGAPALPVRTLRIALPAGHVAHSVSARVLSVETLTSANAKVAPVIDMEGTDSLSVPKPRYVPPDPAAYARTFQRGRQRPARLAGTLRLGEVPVATVMVEAVRFGPDGELELIREIEITVEHRKAPVHDAPRRSSSFTLRQHALARALVVNPGRVDAARHPERSALDLQAPVSPGDSLAGQINDYGVIDMGYLPAEIDYLIVTDDRRWKAKDNLPGPAVPDDPAADSDPPGDLPTAFKKLAQAKRARGLRAEVVKLSAVVAGDYGDFSTGRRDVQEVLRDFLKEVVATRGVEYVLLGGDHAVIPPRLLCGAARGRLELRMLDDDTPPTNDNLPKGCYACYGGYLLIMHIDPKEFETAEGEQRVLTVYHSGQLVPYITDRPVDSNLCWFYCTDDTYNTASHTPTEYVRAEELSETDKPLWYMRNRNLIPSDLYYASLYGDTYDQPGKHDWDQLDNGLYGQWCKDEDEIVQALDGGNCVRHVRLGRASVSTLAEANAFVDKVLGYEDSAARPPETWERFRQMVIAASNWDSYDFMVRKADPDDADKFLDYDTETPPDYHEYVYDPPNNRSVLRVTTKKFSPLGELFAYPSAFMAYKRILISYDPMPGSGNTHWHFAVSHTDLSVNEEPTEWVVVYSDDDKKAEVLTPETFGFDVTNDIDSSIDKSEELFALMRANFPNNVTGIYRLYTDDSDVTQYAGIVNRLTYDSLKTWLGIGPNLFAMSGHGGPSHVSKFLDTAMVTELSNTDAPFIAFVNSCHTGSFDRDDCLGKAMVTKPSSGAVAYMGFSNVCWVDSAWELQLAFFKSLPTLRHLGEMFDSASLDLAPTGAHRWHSYALNLLGDPEMPVYRDKLDLQPFYIGNRRSKELHERHCPWAERMWVGNEIRFDTLDEGLQAGYDGCYYCMRGHHSR